MNISPNRIAMATAAVILLGVVGFVFMGTSQPEITPPDPIPTEPPAPEHAWRDATPEAADGYTMAVLEKGEGRAVAMGDLVAFTMMGWLASTERKFTDTTKHPDKIVLGTDVVLEGVQRALVGMKAGELKQIHLPADLAYGQTGDPPRIPRDADLVIELEVLEVGTPRPVPSQPPEIATDQEASGVKYGVLQPGKGRPSKNGDAVKMHFTTWLADGTFIDSSIKTHDPVTITLGRGEIYAGLEAAVLGMKSGEQRKAEIPPALAFGSEGRGPVPPGSTLIVQVELVAIER